MTAFTSVRITDWQLRNSVPAEKPVYMRPAGTEQKRPQCSVCYYVQACTAAHPGLFMLYIYLNTNGRGAVAMPRCANTYMGPMGRKPSLRCLIAEVSAPSSCKGVELQWHNTCNSSPGMAWMLSSLRGTAEQPLKPLDVPCTELPSAMVLLLSSLLSLQTHTNAEHQLISKRRRIIHGRVQA